MIHKFKSVLSLVALSISIAALPAASNGPLEIDKTILKQPVAPTVEQAAVATFQKTVEFVNSQAPDVIEQFLNWSFYQAVLTIVWGVGISSIFFVCSYWLYKHSYNPDEYKYNYDCDGKRFISFICLFAGILIFSLPVIFGTADLVKLKVAPKMVVVDHVLSAIKPNK